MKVGFSAFLIVTGLIPDVCLTAPGIVEDQEFESTDGSCTIPTRKHTQALNKCTVDASTYPLSAYVWKYVDDGHVSMQVYKDKACEKMWYPKPQVYTVGRCIKGQPSGFHQPRIPDHEYVFCDVSNVSKAIMV